MHLLLNAEEYYITSDEPYFKQTYRNRATILTSQGPIGLTIPIEKRGQRKVSTCKISYAENWQLKHLRTIESAYGKSPFFEHYFPYIEQLFSQKIELLTELNAKALSLCLKFINYKKEPLLGQTDPKDFLNATNTINPKMDSIISSPINYHQMFGSEFAQDLSILDVLFCEGPLAYSIVKTQIKTTFKG